MKKILLLILFVSLGSGVCYAVNARWENGLKLWGYYNYDNSTMEYPDWRATVDGNFIRRSPFTTLAFKFSNKYEMSNNVVTGDAVAKGAFEYIYNMSAFTFWNVYASGRSLYVPNFGDDVYSEGFAVIGRNFSRYTSGKTGIKVTKYIEHPTASKTPKYWFRNNIFFRKPFGYRTLFSWNFATNNELSEMSHYVAESEINLNYKLTRRFSLSIKSINWYDSDVKKLYRKETVDLVFDMFRW